MEKIEFLIVCHDSKFHLNLEKHKNLAFLIKLSSLYFNGQGYFKDPHHCVKGL